MVQTIGISSIMVEIVVKDQTKRIILKEVFMCAQDEEKSSFGKQICFIKL